MVINWFSGGLGLIGLIAVRRGEAWAYHSRLRPSLRLLSGVVAPLALLGICTHQIYTRYIRPPINLMIITVDCARPDFMGMYGADYDPPTTPYLDPAAAHGSVFTNAFSQAAWTSPGVASVLTGLYPPTHGVTTQEESVPEVVQTVLDEFADRGYRVPRMSYLINAAPNFLNLGRFDEDVVSVPSEFEFQQMMDWIDKNHRKPFAVWYHWRYMHLPYYPIIKNWVYPPATIDQETVPDLVERGIDPRSLVDAPDPIKNLVMKEVIIPRFSEQALAEAEARGLPPGEDAPLAHEFPPETRPWLTALFAAQTRAFDSQFEAIRYRLALHHKLEHTIIVITADHGEELLEHGYIGHASTAVHSKHYDECLRIPMIILCPRVIKEGRKIDVIAQQIDILPTIMDMMGWETPDGVQGRSLWPAIQGQPMEDVASFAESVEGGYQSKMVQRSTYVRSIRTREWKFIARMGPHGDQFELYNIVDDPGETKNVFAEYPHITGDFIQKLGEWITQNVDDRLALEERETELQARVAALDPTNLEVPTILTPSNGETITWGALNGAIDAEWTGHPYAAYIIEYDVGEGWHRLQGKYPVPEGTKHRFGPIPKDGWRPLYQWNPYRLRVRPRDLPNGWSDWIEVTVAPLADGEAID
jgi:arylsulfatase A-like enzyme